MPFRAGWMWVWGRWGSEALWASMWDQAVRAGREGVGIFGIVAHNKLQGCQTRKYPTGYLFHKQDQKKKNHFNFVSFLNVLLLALGHCLQVSMLPQLREAVWMMEVPWLFPAKFFLLSKFILLFLELKFFATAS